MAAAEQPAPPVPAGADSPDELWLCFWNAGAQPQEDDDDDEPALVCTLAEFLDDYHELYAADEMLVGLESLNCSDAAVPLRDALLQRCAVPSFGLLPAAWIPDAVRRTEVMHGLLVAARDVAAVLRVLRMQHGQTRCPSVARRAFSRLAALASRTDEWQPADVELVHAQALSAITSPGSMPLLWTEGKLLAAVLGVLAGRRPHLAVPPSAAALMPELVPVASAWARHSSLVRRSVTLWLVWWLEATLPDAEAGSMPLPCAVLEFAVFVIEAEVKANTSEAPVVALRLLRICAQRLDAATAPTCAAVALRLAAALVVALGAPGASSSVVISALTTLPPLLLGLCAARDDAERVTHAEAVLGLVAASRVPDSLVKALKAATTAQGSAVALACTFWTAIARCAHAWPGGALALAARAEEARLACTLATHIKKIGRNHLHAALHELKEAHEAVLGLAAAAAAERAGAAASVAAALLADEAASAAQAQTKAASKAAAKARRAAAAAEAAAARRADEERREAEEVAARAAQAHAQAAARAAAAATAAAAREAAAAAEAAAQAAQAARRQQRQERAAERAAAAAAQAQPPPPPQQQPAAVAPPDVQARASDAELAALFPWMFLDVLPPSAQPAAAAAPAGAAASADGDDGDDGSCAICMDAPRDTVLEPCGHALLCAACARKVLRLAAPLCPVCRAPAASCRAA